MNTNYTRKILFVLLLVPVFYFSYFIITNQGVFYSNMLVIIFSSGVPILGLYLRKKWFLYYIYFGVGFILFSLTLFAGLFIGGTGLWGVISILYFVAIIWCTKKLHKGF